MSYKRVLLKLSGEALKGDTEFGIDPRTVSEIAGEIKQAVDAGIQVGIVVGGGNMWRGKTASELGMERVQADYMGMLATVLNGLAIQDALEHLGIETRVMSAIAAQQAVEPYIRRRALRHLEKNRVVVFVGGTGQPYFSTDTAAAVRCAEIGAEVMLMAKNGVEGVYDSDPRKNPNAKMFKELTHEDLVNKQLAVMDLTAASLLKDNNIEVRVFNMNTKGNIAKVCLGDDTLGTIIR
ncbi:MAG: UMP kinase [bacterium]|nr:UMP kinase [bacterium]